MSRSVELIPAVLAGVAALSIAGCASSSAGAGLPTSPTGGAGGSSHAAAAGSAATGTGAATCKQLTAADAQPMLTRPITSIKVSAVGINTDGQQCDLGGSYGVGIEVTVIGGAHAEQTYDASVSGEDRSVTVSGVGDKASRATEDEQINAFGGGVYCGVTMSSSDDFPGLGTLEEAAGGTIHIDERAYTAAAQALGTLCNRIYGSGNTTPDLSVIRSLAAAASGSSAAGSALPSATLPTDATS